MSARFPDQELPADPFFWYDGNGNLIDFSTGWTFTVKFCAYGTSNPLLGTPKTTGITGAVGSATTVPPTPNLVVSWASGDYAGLTTPARYVYFIYARRTSDNRDDVYDPANPPNFTLLTAPA